MIVIFIVSLEQMNKLELQNSTFALFISYIDVIVLFITDLTGGVITQTQML